MTELLVSVILAVCTGPIPSDRGTNDCMEDINNCAVEKGTGITSKSIQKCVDEYMEKERNERGSTQD